MFVLEILDFIVNIVNAQPDEIRFAVCDIPGFVSTLIDAGYTVYEDCSIVLD